MNSNTIATQEVPDHRPRRKRRVSVRGWWIIAGLLLLTLVPALGGTFRVIELSSNPDITPRNARFVAAPIPVIVHIIGSILYSVLGALQFIRGTRRWWPRVHEKLGLYVLLPSGMAVALSGLWMTLFYPWPVGDGIALYIMRLIVGPVMVIALVRGYLAFRRRAYKAHGAWMLRAYALAMGAGTQVFTHMPWFILHGTATPDELSRAIMMGAGWLINIVIAEWVIMTWINPPKRRQDAATSPA